MGCMGMLLCIDEPYHPLKREYGWPIQIGASPYTAMGGLASFLIIQEPYLLLKTWGLASLSKLRNQTNLIKS